MPSVSPKTDRRLKEIKIDTVGDLATVKPEVLTRQFGVWGARLHEYANGIDFSEVVEEYETKSIGREETFEHGADDTELILSV
jgi:nucleotidyltransferase/DNA polymerase involved in DNA repair